MKKYFFTLGFIAICGMANAQKYSVTEELEVIQGGTVNVALTIDTQSAGVYTGFQFELYVPDGFTAGTATVNTSWETGKLDVGQVGQRVRFLGTSSDVEIPSGEFQVASFNLSVDKSVETGDYPVTIKNFAYLFREDGKTDVAEKTFIVRVVDRLTLAETSTILPSTVSGVNVKVERTIKANTWSTICLPFAMTAAKWQDAFGSDAEIRRFASYEVKNGNIVVKFAEPITGALAANYPHIIKTSKDIEFFNVDAVNVNPDEAASKRAIQEEDPETAEMVDICYFAGVLKANTKIPADNLFLKDGKFYYSTGNTTSDAFRGYFWFKDKVSDASRILIEFDDATGIKSVGPSYDNDKVFDLQGRPVNIPAKGVYIKGGKKVLVK